MTTYGNTYGIGTLFLHRDEWKFSLPTASGFMHHRVGRLNGIANREAAEERLVELIDRGDIPAVAA